MLKELKNVPATRYSNNPALTPRAQTVLGYLVHGIDEPDSDHPDIPTGKPLGSYQVAAILGVRRAYVRGLMSNPVFKVEMSWATADARAALQPKALATLAELLDWQGEGRAPDANVRANAAKTIMGEDAKGFSFNVNVANQVNVGAIRPGYIIDLSEDRDAPPGAGVEPQGKFVPA